jgi:hypothetical protein
MPMEKGQIVAVWQEKDKIADEAFWWQTFPSIKNAIEWFTSDDKSRKLVKEKIENLAICKVIKVIK